MELSEQRIREIVREEIAAQRTANISVMIELLKKPETQEALKEQITRHFVESLGVSDGTLSGPR